MKIVSRLLFLMIISTSLLSADIIENRPQECIEINQSGSISIGDIAVGTTKYYNASNYIKFEIYNCDSQEVRINHLNIEAPDGFIIDAEWKIGYDTGFEEDFVNHGVYSLKDKKIYVTIRLKSVQILPGVINGRYHLSPSISVEAIKL